MAAELKQLGIDAKLTEGSRGIFDVIVDGKRIYSKFETGRFPHPEEISGLIPE